jgi:hypothetical protein
MESLFPQCCCGMLARTEYPALIKVIEEDIR